MSYINIDWIADEHAEYLNDKFDLSAYHDAVDRKMNAVAVKLKVPVPEIPVDVEGYVTSIPFQEYGIILLTRKILSGYWGKRTGNKDIYYQKMVELKDDLADAKRDLTKESIKGPSKEDELPAGDFDNVEQSPY